MNHFLPGTRVLFFTARNEPVQGTVMDRGVGQDGVTLMLRIKPDSGTPIMLPAAAVTKI